MPGLSKSLIMGTAVLCFWPAVHFGIYKAQVMEGLSKELSGNKDQRVASSSENTPDLVSKSPLAVLHSQPLSAQKKGELLPSPGEHLAMRGPLDTGMSPNSLGGSSYEADLLEVAAKPWSGTNLEAVPSPESHALARRPGWQRELEGVEAPALHLQCDLHMTAPVPQRCCQVPLVQLSARAQTSTADKSKATRCLPSFIIAGTQKSGTTALAVMLEMHPAIAMANVKEVHFWDREDQYKKGLPFYASYFPSIEHEGPQPFVTGEATPFYLASREACERISTHVPGTKLVILVREPVARAFSEYQMGMRRLEIERELLGLVKLHTEKLCSCMLDPMGSLHPPAPDAAATRCSLKSANLESINQLAKGGNFAVYLKTVGKCIPEISSHVWWSKLLGPLVNQAKLFMEGKTPAVAVVGKGKTPGEVIELLVRRCFPASKPFALECYLRRERLPDLHSAFNSQLREMTSWLGTPYADGSGGTEFIQRADDALDDHMTVLRGLRGQHVYRSMFALQLHHCSKFIPMSDILVIDGEQLKTAPEQTVNDVAAFLGLPPLTDQVLSPEVVAKTLQAKYPSFEKMTGWKQAAAYDPMPEQLRREMREFFKPYNEILFEMIGQRFASWG
ncbi:unnamed protein product [Chrysoparadoxa australica]